MSRRLSILLLLSIPAAAQTPRSEVIVTGPPNDAVEPSVACDGNLSAAYWTDFVTNIPRVSVSDGTGRSWTPPVRLDSDVLGAIKSSEIHGIAVAGDDIYTAWNDERFGVAQDEVYLNRSTDRGASWIGETRIDYGLSPAIAGVRDWRMAVSSDPGGDHVYFLFAVDPVPNSDEDLYLVASHDSGGTFGAAVSPTALPVGAADVDDIDLAVDGLNVYVTWRDDRFGSDDEIFFQKSTDGGLTWLATDVLLSTVGDFRDSDDEVQIAVSGSTVAVAFQEDSSCCSAHELRATVSTNGGASWSGAKKVGAYTTNIDDVDLRTGSMVVLPSGSVVLAWGDDRVAGLNVNEIYVSRSSDGGTSWSSDLRLSVNTGGSPKLASDGNRVAATWPDGTAVDRPAATFSEDSGGAWSSTFFLPTPAGVDIDDPHLAFSNQYGNLIQVWRADPLVTHSVYSGGYTLCVTGAPPASSVVRNGTGVNPLLLSAVSDVRLGGVWAVDLDCSGFAPGLANLTLWANQATTLLLPYGELLGANRLAGFFFPHAGAVVGFSAPVPNDPSICGLSSVAQGVCFGNPGPTLTNALDLVVGR